jgi:hypothetical protein
MLPKPPPNVDIFEIALQEDMHFNIVQLNGAMNEMNMCNFHVKYLPYLRPVGVCIPIILNPRTVTPGSGRPGACLKSIYVSMGDI